MSEPEAQSTPRFRPGLDPVATMPATTGGTAGGPPWDQSGKLEVRAWNTSRDLRAFASVYVATALIGALVFGFLAYHALTSDDPSGEAATIFFAWAIAVLFGNLLAAAILRGLALIVEATARTYTESHASGATGAT
jgi:hypothetical protein